MDPLSIEQVLDARVAFSCRRLPFDDPGMDWTGLALLSGPIRPRPGDVVLAEVARVGHHRRIELASGRKPALVAGDKIVVAYGDRYAPDQFESEIPPHLGPTNLSAAGGVAASVLSRHSSTRRPTDIRPLGLLSDRVGTPINLADVAIARQPITERPPVIAVLGTSMNAGKTTTVATLIKGLVASGERVGGTKVTGTGAGGDYWSMVDAGAAEVVDFTDAGHASTYKLPFGVVEDTLETLVSHLASRGCSTIVVEVADGIYQRETAALIRSEVFSRLVDGVIFAAGDAIGAVAGSDLLLGMGLQVIGISGACTAAPLAIGEISENSVVPVFTKNELSSAPIAAGLASQVVTRPFVIDLCDEPSRRLVEAVS